TGTTGGTAAIGNFLAGALFLAAGFAFLLAGLAFADGAVFLAAGRVLAATRAALAFPTVLPRAADRDAAGDVFLAVFLLVRPPDAARGPALAFEAVFLPAAFAFAT